MKSKTSLFNKTIFNNNIKRVWPFWGLLSFFALLPSLLIIVESFRGYSEISTEPLEMKYLYYQCATYIAPFVAFATAIIAAMLVWSYLDSTRSVGFYHSIPISKTGLFVTQFVSGLTIMLIPYAIGGAAFILTVLCLGGGFPLATLVCIGTVIADSFFFFAFATLIAHLTGNILALPALYLVFNFLFIALENLLNFVCSSFLFGLDFELSDKTAFLTPIYKLLSDVYVNTEYSPWSPFSANYEGSRLISVEWVNYHWVLIYAAVGVVFAIGALMIYKRRRSEAAGDVISTKCLKPIIHAVYVVTVTGLFGLLLYYMFNEGIIDCRMKIVLAIICFGVAATIAYYTGLMLLEKTVKVFNKKTLKGLIVTLAAVVVICFGVKYDVLKVERRIPKLSDIETVEVISQNNFYLDGKKDQELVQKTLDIHKLIIDNKRVLVSEMYGDMNDEYRYDGYVSFFYHLKDGSTMVRRYNIDLNKENHKELFEQYKNYMTDRDMTLRVMHDNDDYEIESADFNINWDHDERYPSGLEYGRYELTDKQIRNLYEAVKADLQEGSWEPGFSDKEGVANIYFNFEKLMDQTEYRSYYSYDTLYVDVKDNMKHSLEAIADIMGVPHEDLMNDARKYAKDMEEWNKEHRYDDMNVEYYEYRD